MGIFTRAEQVIKLGWADADADADADLTDAGAGTFVSMCSAHTATELVANGTVSVAAGFMP